MKTGKSSLFFLKKRQLLPFIIFSIFSCRNSTFVDVNTDNKSVPLRKSAIIEQIKYDEDFIKMAKSQETAVSMVMQMLGNLNESDKEDLLSKVSAGSESSKKAFTDLFHKNNLSSKLIEHTSDMVNQYKKIEAKYFIPNTLTENETKSIIKELLSNFAKNGRVNSSCSNAFMDCTSAAFFGMVAYDLYCYTKPLESQNECLSDAGIGFGIAVGGCGLSYSQCNEQ